MELHGHFLHFIVITLNMFKVDLQQLLPDFKIFHWVLVFKGVLNNC